MLQDFTVGAFASALTGIVLWAVLPRGAALTRRLRTTDWDGQPPLRATVMNNRDLRIKYRRAGWTGVFERREIKVHGGV